MFEVIKDENYYVIGVAGKYIRVGKQLIENSENRSAIDVFSMRLSDEEAVAVIKDLKSQRDLISFGLSLNGESLTSDRITEIDQVISKLSERFISS
jgi:uncharacterized Zn ribbon protein